MYAFNEKEIAPEVESVIFFNIHIWSSNEYPRVLAIKSVKSLYKISLYIIWL